MNKKIFFFDIDGTFVDSNTNIVPESALLALSKLREQGHILCVSTGRSLQSVKDGGFDTIFDWNVYLCNNGQAIYDHEKNILFTIPIPKESVEECMRVADSLDSPLYLVLPNDQLLTKEANEYVRISSDFFKETIPDVKPYYGSEVIMMLAYGPMGYNYDEYKAIEGLDVLIGQSTYADVVLKGFNKAIGIKKVLDHFNMDSYIAFGDSLNDVEMLKHAEIGVAMGNGHEETKRCADYVTDDVANDGIYNALKHLGIL